MVVRYIFGILVIAQFILLVLLIAAGNAEARQLLATLAPAEAGKATGAGVAEPR